jgi:hypothetical protein
MDAEIRFLDGETRSFPNAGSLRLQGDAVVVRRWFRTVAILPLSMIRWATLTGRRKVFQRDFGKAAL